MTAQKTHGTKAMLLVVACVLVVAFCVFGTACNKDKQTAAPNTQTQPAEQAETPKDEAPITNGEIVNDTLKVKGVVENGIASYKGIPYAQPPVGELRFCPPQPATPWTDVLDCTQFRSCAIQPLVSEADRATPSEDCLYLNVWAPEDAAGKSLPVYFWIHGGAYCEGSGSNMVYDGAALASNDIVVVTINYRLGALGFLGLQTSLDEWQTTGNWGTLDQIAALQWVHDNIAAFGGNPANVTIGGESAGAFSVSNLVMSPLTEGLFSRAILESGSLFGNQAAVPFTCARLDETIALSQEYAAQFGATDSPEGLEILRSIDAATLCSMAPFTANQTSSSRYTFWATQDGFVIPSDPVDALLRGQYNQVPLLIGCNKDEGASFIPAITTQDQFETYVYKTFKGDNARLVLDYYALGEQATWTPAQKARDAVGMAFFKAGMALMEDEFSKAGLPVYVYQFDYVSPGTDAADGVPHASELPYVFGTNELLKKERNATSEKIEDQMHGMWSNFIVNGDPNVGLTNLPYKVAWPAYDYLNPQIYSIQSDVKVTARESEETVELFKHVMFE